MVYLLQSKTINTHLFSKTILLSKEKHKRQYQIKKIFNMRIPTAYRYITDYYYIYVFKRYNFLITNCNLKFNYSLRII